MKMKSKLIAVVMSITLALTMMPMTGSPAYAAAEPYEQVGTSYKIDGVTYYDVGDEEGKNFADPGEYNFLGRALSAELGKIENNRLTRPTNTYNKKYTPSMCYDTIGCAVMDPKKDDSKYDGFIQLSRTMFKDLAQRVKGGNGQKPDLAVDGDAWSSIDQGPMTGFFFYKSELTKASSMAQAELLFEEYVRSKGRMNDYQRKFQDDTQAQTIFLTTFVMTLGSGKSNSSDQTKYAVAVIYNDFKITPLIPDDSALGNYEVKDDEPIISNTSIGSSVKNLTGETVNADQKIASASSATASSQVSGSRSYGFEESISIGTGMKFGLVSATMNVSFTASQTMESGWSREESCSEETSREHGVGVELPPHTAVMMNQKSVEKKRLTTYSCPVSVSCRVRVFGMGSHETQKPELKPMADIKSAKDLRQRAITNRGVIDTEGINWDAIMEEDKPANTYKKSVEGIALTRPTGRTDASFTESTKSVDGEVSNIKPIYPLNKIKTKDKIYEYQMSTGDYTYVNGIDLEGLNTQNIEYYGFNPDRGEWKVVDNEGKPTGDSSIVSLEETPAKLTRLKANGPGTAWIKYYIDEKFYSTADHPNIYRKNDELSRTAIIEIQVEEKPFVGSIDVSGSFTGYVGDDYTSFTGEDGLQASVVDETGKELERMVVWEAKELPSKGVEVKGNTIRFTKEGTFHVRAVSGDVASDWVTVFGAYAEPMPPTIKTQPRDLELTYGDTAVNTLEVEATAENDCTLSYQWYSKEAGDAEAVILENETNASYEIPLNKNVGTTYYYCEVTATSVPHGTKSTTTSDTAAVTTGKAKITITADDKSSKAGEALQDLTYKVSGAYVEGDDLGIMVSTDADKDKAGTYDIEVGWNNNKNYEASLVNGKYTVTAAPPPKTSGTPLARASVKKNSMTIGWHKIEGAEGYDIFFARCDHSHKDMVCKNVKTIKGNKTFKWTKSGLKKGTAYKFYVRAYVTKDGKKTYVSKSPIMHAYTGNGTKKYTNAKSVSVNKAKVTLTKGKTFKIKAKVNKISKKKKLMPKSHAPTLRYMTSDSKVATVSKSGKITAKGKGKCTVIAFAHNGVSKTIKVTVK